jgi:dephospho-CoA kinase
MLLGITGKYCAGKNHAAAIFEKRGFSVLDVDKLGHIAIERKKDEIFLQFGKSIKNPDNSINRRLLGEKVFGKEKEMALLETIVHPEANRLTLEWLAAQNSRDCVINAALLHKSAVFGQLDCIILVDAPFFIRLLRARHRDKLSWCAIIRRFLSQRYFFTQYFTGNADIYRVENSGLKKQGLSLNSAGKKTKLECRIDRILSTLELESWKKLGGL